jgi:hypothetical protein
MAGNGEKITRHQELAISALIQHSTISSAAKAIGISEATLRRWKKLPGFAVAYSKARRELVTDTIAMLQRAGHAAMATLVTIMTSATASASARAGAARTILELGLRERPVGLHIAAPTNTARISKGLAQVIKATMRGDISPEEAKQVASVFRTALDAAAMAELEKRLAALEEQGGKRRDGFSGADAYDEEAA